MSALRIRLTVAGGALMSVFAQGCRGHDDPSVGDAGSPDAAGPLDAGDAVAYWRVADTGAPPPRDGSAAELLAKARQKLQHVVIINQENRSFDHYFGTFPGAAGIPMDGGVPTVCATVPDGGCVPPFHDRRDQNSGGPHSALSASLCVADGGMNGFIRSVIEGRKHHCKGPTDPDCSSSKTDDVMGYHDDREIPNYWAYARAFALQDHMFEPVASYSLPDHLYMVSGWSATCFPPSSPTGCVSDLDNPGDGHHLSVVGDHLIPPEPEYAWTDVTYLLHRHHVSWGYFVAGGRQPDCDDGSATCDAGLQDYRYPSYWNVLPWFDDVKADDEVGNVMDTERFFAALGEGKLAAVSWLVPSFELSEHPAALVSAGQAYVTGVINAIMRSPFWDSTVIFLTWDDWGGFYDHVLPVTADANGYGLRVPGLTISPWVKPHQLDHAVYSHDAYLRLIEDLFTDSERLDPSTDGRRDTRPTVREALPTMANLLDEFDFDQPPNPALILPECPAGVDTELGRSSPCAR